MFSAIEWGDVLVEVFVLVTLCPLRRRQRRITIYKGSFMVPDASAFCVAVRLGGSLVMFVAGCTESVGSKWVQQQHEFLSIRVVVSSALISLNRRPVCWPGQFVRRTSQE